MSDLPWGSALFWPASRGLTAAGPVKGSVSTDIWLLGTLYDAVLGVVWGEVGVIGDEVVADEVEVEDEVLGEELEVMVEVETRSWMMVGVGTRSRMMEADVRGEGAGVRVLEAGGAGPVVLLMREDGGLTVDRGDSDSLGFDGGDVVASGSVMEGGAEGGEEGGEGGEEGGEDFGDDGEAEETLEWVVVGREESPGGDVGSVGLGLEATKEVPAAPVGLGGDWVA